MDLADIVERLSGQEEAIRRLENEVRSARDVIRFLTTESARQATRKDSDTMSLVFRVPGKRTEERRWPGYVVVGGVCFYDSSFGACPYASPESITDNSGGVKTWLVLFFGTGAYGTTVSYESGPPPTPLPDAQEWYYVPHLIEPPRVTRF